MQNAATVRKRLTPAQREDVLKRYRRSGLSQRDFALEAGISVSTLQLWLRKAADMSGPSPGGFIQLPNGLASAGMVSKHPYRLHLGDGMTLDIGSGFCPEELAALLALLPSVCSR